MKNINKKTILIVVIALIVGVLIGLWTGGGHKHTDEELGTETEHTIWTCSMHPQIRQDGPGSCPICGMDLTPLAQEEEESDLPAGALKMSATAMQLANIRTLTIGREESNMELRLSGKLTVDQEHLFAQNAHVGGRIENLMVNTIGEYVQAGKQIASIYSPELINAQRELLQAYQSREDYPALYKAVEEKFQLWKVKPDQIQKIISSGKVQENLPIYANASGYVMRKNVSKGDYLQGGEVLYELADLKKLWLEFDVFEKEAFSIKKGMKVDYYFNAMPGKTFSGKLDFIEPILDPVTRTFKARVNILNPNLSFKPEMLATGIVYINIPNDGSSIVIPKSAVMWTGKNSVVYVKHETDNQIGFQMRPVVLGMALEDSYVVSEGLEIGEEIVVEGTFSVDAAAQLANKPSMMNRAHPAEHRVALPASIELNSDQKLRLQPLYESYFKLKDALVKDDQQGASQAFTHFLKDWKGLDWKKFPVEVQQMLKTTDGLRKLETNNRGTLSSLEDIRKDFLSLSTVLVTLTKSIKNIDQTVFLQHCPMVDNDQGADWLSQEKEVLNPYYGSAMLTCGEVVQVFN